MDINIYYEIQELSRDVSSMRDDIYFDEYERDNVERRLDEIFSLKRKYGNSIEEILKYDNIKLFSFSDNFELICNLDVYRDQGHYSPDINSQILKWIKAGDYELTESNYEEHLEKRRAFYKTYNYESIYQ